MKKHLIAAAVAAAVAGPVAAQVTVYGIIETGLQSFDNGTTTYNRAIDGAVNTSRLGFRGKEDLGGGLQAEFQMEMRINPSQGGAGQNNANRMFNRELWAGLSGGFGSVRIGAMDLTDAVSIHTGVGVSGNLADGQSKTAVGADRTNSIRYTTPVFNGFSGQIGFATGTNRESGTDNSATDMSSYFVQYAQGPVKVQAGVVSGDGASSVAEVGLTSYGASYNFGIARVGFAYSKFDTSTTNDVDYKQSILSVAVPLGSGLTLHGVMNTAKDISNDKLKGNTIALNKDLSKRTYATAFYGRQSAEATSEAIGMANVLAGSAVGANTSTFGFVVGHKF
jgi:predicted porin